MRLCDFPFISINDAASLLKVDIKTIYNWRKQNIIEIFKLGRKSYLNISQVKSKITSGKDKLCTKCRKVKPIFDFNYYGGWCRDCNANYRKKYVKIKKEKRKELYKKYGIKQI